MANNKLRLTTLVGTRPELIRLSMVIAKFDELFEHRVIHTGQNSQHELQQLFLDDLQIRKPDKFLAVTNESLGNFLSKVFLEFACGNNS
jgi:UDP-N-acetylglucosamine 2-epimerase (non-hydrolysing)